MIIKNLLFAHNQEEKTIKKLVLNRDITKIHLEEFDQVKRPSLTTSSSSRKASEIWEHCIRYVNEYK